MKKLLVLIPFFLNAESFNELVKYIDNSNSIKISKKDISIQQEKLKEAKSQNWGKAYVEYDYSHLAQYPVRISHSQSIKSGEKNNFSGALIYSYPLFSGFGITHTINIEKLNLLKAKLDLENIKRNLIITTANLYANIYAENKNIKALKEEKKLLLSEQNQASALYKEGLINKAFLDNIDAKYYEIEASITETQNKRDILLNNLSYLLNKKITSISTLPKEHIKNANILNRADLKALKTSLNIARKYIKMSKSNFLPTINLQAGIKKESTNMMLSRNDYQNVDKSFVAISFKYNIFNGGADKAKLQEAKIKRAKTFIYFNDYINKVKTDYQNDIVNLKTLKKRLIAAKKEVVARESYYKYIKAKFKQGLADVIDLNSALAKLADSKSKIGYIKSQIFFYTIKANKDGGS